MLKETRTRGEETRDDSRAVRTTLSPVFHVCCAFRMHARAPSTTPNPTSHPPTQPCANSEILHSRCALGFDECTSLYKWRSVIGSTRTRGREYDQLRLNRRNTLAERDSRIDRPPGPLWFSTIVCEPIEFETPPFGPLGQHNRPGFVIFSNVS